MTSPVSSAHSADQVPATTSAGASGKGGSTLRSPRQLADAGLIPETMLQDVGKVAARYATAIPPAFLSLIETPDDPVGLQVIPHPDELILAPSERDDPIGDDALSPVPGIVHRYADRALLKPLLICPLYCRFCFRREHVGPDGGLLDDMALGKALDWLRAHEQIREVILTGGDPLMLSARRLEHIVRALSEMSHITTIRIHSRVPLADPGRITDALIAAMETDRAMWLVLHANHEREFSPEGRVAVRRMQKCGIPVLGQSVLLRGVNDSVSALEGLFRAMVENRVKPYYLHQLDPAPGTARFHVPVEEGRALLRGLRGRVTGLAWPTYVLDIPGGYGKVPLGPDYLDPGGDSVTDPQGQLHRVSDL